MRRMGKVLITLAIAFALLFMLNLSGFGQATAPNSGTATNPSTTLPAQNPGRPAIQPGIGTTTPNSIPEQLPNTTTPNSTVAPNQNPNMVPNLYPNTVPNVPYPNPNSKVNRGVTDPNVRPGTQPNISIGNPAPYATPVPGVGGVPGR